MKQILTFLLLAISFTLSAQKPEDAVKSIINQLFTAMNQSDGELLKKCFADSAILQTIVPIKSGGVQVKNESIEDFAHSIRTSTKGTLEEKITYEMIKIDGPLASVWTPYSFYFNGKFSHCGVNAFLLVQTAAGWKIQYIIDTKRRTDCK